jgi:hypothetical protein
LYFLTTASENYKMFMAHCDYTWPCDVGGNQPLKSDTLRKVNKEELYNEILPTRGEAY